MIFDSVQIKTRKKTFQLSHTNSQPESSIKILTEI
jgi:hypothetical protein